METEDSQEELSRQESVRSAIVKKFGEGYKEEKMVRIGDYYFYIDRRNGGGDYMYKPERIASIDSREKEVRQYMEELQEMSRLFSRYGVKQEDIRGVSLMGSVMYVTLSKKKSDGGFHSEKVIVRGKDGVIGEGSDLSEFGIKTLNMGMGQHEILDVKNEIAVDDPSELAEIAVDSVEERLRYWIDKTTKGGGYGRFSLSKFDLPGLPEADSGGIREIQIFDLLKNILQRMEMIEKGPGGNDSVSLDGRRRKELENFKDLLAISLIDLSEYFEATKEGKYDEDTMKQIREARAHWVRIEDGIANREEILIGVPEDLGLVPAIYLLVQRVAEKYSDGEEMQKKDVRDYWSRVRFVQRVDGNILGVENNGSRKLLVTSRRDEYEDDDTMSLKDKWYVLEVLDQARETDVVELFPSLKV